MPPSRSLRLSLLHVLVLILLTFFAVFASGRESSQLLHTERVLRQVSPRDDPSSSTGIFGLLPEPGQSVDPKEDGVLGQLNEAIETEIRPLPRSANIITKSDAMAGGSATTASGVYMSDFARLEQEGRYICNTRDGEVCEVAPDRFSRAGYVLRNGTEDSPGVNRKAMSLETMNTCICLDPSCREIAEVRAVAFFENEAAIASREPREHTCVLRRRVDGGRFIGCAQSLLIAKNRQFDEVHDEIGRFRKFMEGRDAKEDLFPPHVASWAFGFDRHPTSFNATGFRPYFNTMFVKEFDGLTRVDFSDPGWKIESILKREDLLDGQPAPGQVEIVAFANATEGQSCADKANLTLHAAAKEATRLDDVGRGVIDESFEKPLPPRASRTDIALSIGAALLGIATLCHLLVNILLESAKVQERGGGGGGSGRGRFCEGGGQVGYVMGLVCKWPVMLVWMFGLFLLGLEMTALTIVWIDERKAMNTLGKFIHASFVAALAPDKGSLPGLIDEKGNVLVATVIVGNARYTRSKEVLLGVLEPVLIVLGFVSIVLAVCLVIIWRSFSRKEIETNAGDEEQGSGDGFVGTGTQVGRSARTEAGETGSVDVVDDDRNSFNYINVAEGSIMSISQPFRTASYNPAPRRRVL